MSTDKKPTFRQVKTILGVTRELEASTPTIPLNDTRATLNSLYNIFPEEIPNSVPPIRYFGVGINGRYNVTDSNLQEPHEVLSTNMNLYGLIPLRIVPLEQDLSPAEMSNYRLRKVITVNNTSMVYYYLKVLTQLSGSVQYTKTDPTNPNAEIPYELDYSNLTPTPPVPPINGVVTSITDEINVSVNIRASILGSEVSEVINFLYNGDMRYAMISEFGLYSGQDRTMTARDHTNTPFNYTEAIGVMLNTHYTWNGVDLSNPTSFHDLDFRLGKSDVILL